MGCDKFTYLEKEIKNKRYGLYNMKTENDSHHHNGIKNYPNDKMSFQLQSNNINVYWFKNIYLELNLQMRVHLCTRHLIALPNSIKVCYWYNYLILMSLKVFEIRIW